MYLLFTLYEVLLVDAEVKTIWHLKELNNSVKTSKKVVDRINGAVFFFTYITYELNSVEICTVIEVTFNSYSYS